MTRVVCWEFSKSAKHKMTFSPGFFSRWINLTDLKPGKGRKISKSKDGNKLTSNLSLLGVERDSFNVDCVGGIFRNGHDIGCKETRDSRHCLRELVGLRQRLI